MTKANVAALREQFETLFPGKWVSQSNSHRTVLTGLPQIDHGLTHGLMRRRIAEWCGSESSGKSTLLRAAVRHWCRLGFYIAYVDSRNKLVASDWTFISDASDASDANDANDANEADQPDLPLFGRKLSGRGQAGKFWVARNLKEQDVLWATEQLIRSNIFDVVILDVAQANGLNSKAYARLQRALDRSKTAFILLKDERINMTATNTTWGCDSRFKFAWSDQINCEIGINGIVAMQPDIQGVVWRDGMSQAIEVNGSTDVSNRLFTHPQIPDRRTPKSRAGA